MSGDPTVEIKSEVSAGNLGIIVTIAMACVSVIYAGSGRLATQDAEISTIKTEIAQGRGEDREFKGKVDERLNRVDDKLSTIIDRLARIETLQTGAPIKHTSLDSYK